MQALPSSSCSRRADRNLAAPTALATTTPNVSPPTANPATSLTGSTQTAQLAKPSSSARVGAIIGGVIGGLALISTLGICFWYTCFRTRQGDSSSPISSATGLFKGLRWRSRSGQGRSRNDCEETEEDIRRASQLPEVKQQVEMRALEVVSEVSGNQLPAEADDSPNKGRLVEGHQAQPTKSTSPVMQTTEQGRDEYTESVIAESLD